MKVRLAYRDRDLDVNVALPSNVDALTQDLGIDLVLDAMAGGDKYLRGVAQYTFFASLQNEDEIRYRQAVLNDCIAHPDVVRELYDIALAGLQLGRKNWLYSPQFPESVLRRGISFIGAMFVNFRRLREIATAQSAAFTSEGFTRLFDELARDLDENYLSTVAAHLQRLAFGGGVRVSATLGTTNADTTYVLRRRVQPLNWRERIGFGGPDSQTFELDPRDIAGAEELGSLRGRGVALAATALGESTEHILNYLEQLHAEVGFLLGCLMLRDRLVHKGGPVCMPEPRQPGAPVLVARGLYDAGLSLAMDYDRVVGSDIDAEDKPLIVITGANRGGKSTFLRSIGLAQLMMQAGMFVAADSYCADIRGSLHTHFRREEEAELRSGKLDEELTRMSSIVDALGLDGMVLFNESFSSTNELEGSEIGREIVRALLEQGVKVAYVTHMFDLADSLHREWHDKGAFLRAERLPDGRRTFRLLSGEPLPTSYGQDLYQRIFGDATATDEGSAVTPHE